MALLIDSAKTDEIRQAAGLGFLCGVTTNPSIMAKVEGRPEDVIEQICALSPGPVFYQVTAATPEAREAEGRTFSAICPAKVCLKIPATTGNMALIARLAKDIPCAATAVYSGAQAYVAGLAGATYLIPYVNRATRLLGDGIALVKEIAAVADALGRDGREVQIVAASIKSAPEAVATVLAGAHHLTLPLETLLSLGNHPLSEQAIAEFEADRARRG